MVEREGALAALARAGIAYELTPHAAVYTIDEMCALALPHGDRVAKNLFLRDDKKRNYYLVVAREDKRVDLKALRQTLGARPLSFASETDLNALLGLSAGSVTPLGVLNDGERRVRVFIDRAFQGGLIGVHPNDNRATVWLQADELLRFIRKNGNEADWAAL